MEKIKVKGKLYEIQSIQTTEAHVLQIVLPVRRLQSGTVTLYFTRPETSSVLC